MIIRTWESEITNGPKLVVVEIFPTLSTEATWNHRVPKVVVAVVVEVVKDTPGAVELEIIVAFELSQRTRYPAKPDWASVELVQKILAVVIMVPVALAAVIVGTVGGRISGLIAKLAVTERLPVTLVSVRGVATEASDQSTK